MMNDSLLKLAESGKWKDRAIELLQEKTDAGISVIHEFVSDWWQNLLSDESNIESFNEFISEQDIDDF